MTLVESPHRDPFLTMATDEALEEWVDTAVRMLRRDGLIVDPSEFTFSELPFYPLEKA